MLWEDTCPRTFNDFHSQSYLINNLKNLSNKIRDGGCLPNIIIYGQEQTGKYTLAKCLLNEIYGSDIYNIKEVEHNIRQNCSNYSIRINKSKYHYETTLSGLQYADRSMLISLLDNYFTTTDINTHNHKIILIKHFDELTKPAQYALRRRMEKGWGTVRYILLVNSFNKIEPAIKSRCLCIRCPKPNNIEIKSYLKAILNRKNIEINQEMVNKATSLSNHIMSNAIYYLSYMINSNSLDIICPINTAIDDLVKYLYIKPFPYDNIRDIIARLQLSRISHTKIFRKIIEECTLYFGNSNEYIYKIIQLSAKYDMVASTTNKFSIAVETFVVSVYNIIREFEKLT